MDRAINRLAFGVEHFHVLTLRPPENERSGVAFVAGLTRSSLQMVIMFGTSNFSFLSRRLNFLTIHSGNQGDLQTFA